MVLRGACRREQASLKSPLAFHNLAHHRTVYDSLFAPAKFSTPCSMFSGVVGMLTNQSLPGQARNPFPLIDIVRLQNATCRCLALLSKLRR